MATERGVLCCSTIVFTPKRCWPERSVEAMNTTVGHLIERAGFHSRLDVPIVLSNDLPAPCSAAVRHPFDGKLDGLCGSYQDCKLLGARQARVQQIAAEQHIVLRAYIGCFFDVNPFRSSRTLFA